jgi:hypothetical protein
MRCANGRATPNRCQNDAIWKLNPDFRDPGDTFPPGIAEFIATTVVCALHRGPQIVWAADGDCMWLPFVDVSN